MLNSFLFFSWVQSWIRFFRGAFHYDEKAKKSASERIKKFRHEERVRRSVANVKENVERTMNTFVLVLALFILWHLELVRVYLCARVRTRVYSIFCVYMQHVFVAAANVSVQYRNLIAWASLLLVMTMMMIFKCVWVCLCAWAFTHRKQMRAFSQRMIKIHTHSHRHSNAMRVAPLTTAQTISHKRLL